MVVTHIYLFQLKFILLLKKLYFSENFYYMRKKVSLLLLVISVVILSTTAKAQVSVGASFGYNINRFFTPLHNLEIPIHQFNVDNPQFETHYKLPVIGQGFYASFNFGGPRGGIEFIYKNNHGITEAKGIPAGDTRVFIKRLKYRTNIYGFGPYFNIGKRGNFRFGMIMDFGTFGVYKKSAPENEFKQKDYEKFYTKNAFLMGGTFYLKYSFKIFGPIHLAVQPYIDWLTNLTGPTYTVDYIDKNYHYNESSYGIIFALELKNK